MKDRDVPVRPDSMLIEPDHIVSARQEIGEQGGAEAMQDLAGREPALATYIQESMAAMAGKLALSGAPTPLVQGLFNEALLVVLASVEAQRRGHYDLWKDTLVGTPLERLAQPDTPPPPGKPRRRRKGSGPK